MPTPPIAINKRPFAIEPVTGIMLPDGIFDSCIFKLDIALYITNISDEEIKEDFWVRLLNKASDDWRLLSGWMIHIGSLAPGASQLVRWKCDFQDAEPGKKELTVEFGGGIGDHGVDGYIHQTIFVSRTTYDAATKTYNCEIPEGNLNVSIEEVLYSKPSFYNKFDKELHKYVRYDLPAVPLPTKISSIFIPAAGHEDELPFNDPLNKIIAWIIFAIAAILAYVAAENGQGEVGINLTGHDDDTNETHWCKPDTNKGLTWAGVFSLIASWAFKCGFADNIDPWLRGRNETLLLPGEVTVRERVNAKIEVPKKIEAGADFSIPIEWTYIRTTNHGRELALTRKEVNTNFDVVKNVEIISPPAFVQKNSNVIVRIRIQRQDGSYYVGDEIFGSAVFVSPGDEPNIFQIPLSDSGKGYDRTANDGWFTAGMSLEKIADQFEGRNLIGDWEVLYFVQNVNAASQGMEPLDAAQFIGGNPLICSYSINLFENDENQPKPEDPTPEEPKPQDPKPDEPAKDLCERSDALTSKFTVTD